MSVRALAGDLWKARAFFIRNCCDTKRQFSWFLALLVHAVVSNAAVLLIGVAGNDPMRTLGLAIGVVQWAFLSLLFEEIAYSIYQERVDGVIEETFAAPVSRVSHLAGIVLFAWCKALLQVVLIVVSLTVFVRLDITGANWAGTLLVMIAAGASFIGIGLVAATLPLINAERGYQANVIVQGILLLISGVFYPIAVLPEWLRSISCLSPATHAMNAARQLMGVGIPGSRIGALSGQSLESVATEVALMGVVGILSIPIGFLVFGAAESRAKRSGSLKRSG